VKIRTALLIRCLLVPDEEMRSASSLGLQCMLHKLLRIPLFSDIRDRMSAFI
jgi:hypothetical protein